MSNHSQQHTPVTISVQSFHIVLFKKKNVILACSTIYIQKHLLWIVYASYFFSAVVRAFSFFDLLLLWLSCNWTTQCQAYGTAGVCSISYQGSPKQSTSTLICTVHTRSQNIKVQPQNKNTHNRQHIANHSQLQLIFIHTVSFGWDYAVTLQDEYKSMKFHNNKKNHNMETMWVLSNYDVYDIQSKCICS